MRTLWQKEYCLRASDFDKYKHIYPSAVLELFQDAAGQHALEIGLGFDDMIRNSHLWVLTKVKFKIISQPENYQKVIIKTWPLAPNRLIYRREYSIETENGEKMIVGSSEWVVIHSEKRRLVSVPELYPFKDGFHEEMMFDEKLGKVSDFEINNDTSRIIKAGFTEIDVNNHVNNTKYANYVLDAINPLKEDEIDTFQIDYRKEVLEGIELRVHHTKQGNISLAKGLNENDEIMFACKIEFK